ncbi:hypothetical protein, partial [Coxiella burnetii]
CNINTQYFNIFHGPSPFFENRNSMLAHYDAVFKGWVHFIGLLVENLHFQSHPVGWAEFAKPNSIKFIK